MAQKEESIIQHMPEKQSGIVEIFPSKYDKTNLQYIMHFFHNLQMGI